MIEVYSKDELIAWFVQNMPDDAQIKIDCLYDTSTGYTDPPLTLDNFAEHISGGNAVTMNMAMANRDMKSLIHCRWFTSSVGRDKWVDLIGKFFPDRFRMDIQLMNAFHGTNIGVDQIKSVYSIPGNSVAIGSSIGPPKTHECADFTFDILLNEVRKIKLEK